MSFINLFLKTELTVIPRYIDKYIGNYYNNTLCNGATWMFVIWFVVHVIFENLLNGLLRRMKVKHYVRLRLQKSLWYFGFYTTALLYSSATLLRNDIKLVTTNEPFDGTNSTSGHLILGYIVLLTFYLHSMLWAKIKQNDTILSLIYLSLSLLMFASYFLRFVEGIFRLTILICLTQVALELARCTALTKRDVFKGAVVTRALFIASLVTFVANYFIFVPLLLGLPLIKKFSISGFFLWVCLVVWLILEIYASVLFKAIYHWLNHIKESETDCQKDIFECSLFPPRSDATYNYCMLKKEMAERQAQVLLLRKPKARNVVFQTLKCMVAIKKKLNQRRQSASLLNDDSSNDKQSLEDDGVTNNEISNSVEEPEGQEEEVVGGRLTFNINSKNGNEEKYKKDN